MYRDLQLIDKDDQDYLAIACDVSAGIGQKPYDTIHVDNQTAGYYAAAVPLIELLCIGAEPISVINTLGVEMNPSGIEIISGIHKAMDEARLDHQFISGSTEDNIPTSTTSIGVTVISTVKKNFLQQHLPQRGQHVYLVGLPKMGRQLLEEEIRGNKGEIITIELVKRLRLYDRVGHMLPVGSKGIRYEAETMAHLNNLGCMLKSNTGIDFEASAGPATCMIVSMYSKDAMFLELQTSQPVTQIGLLL